MDTSRIETVEVTAEKLLEDLKAVVNDGEELLRAGARDLGDKGRAARERLSAALEVAKDTQRRLQEQVISSAKATDQLVQEYPYYAAGIAFGFGLLVGVLINRRK
jgi:ElaB/YqjD/DUF883 family membrane-anchored ribosome-binding protein